MRVTVNQLFLQAFFDARIKGIPNEQIMAILPKQKLHIFLR